MKTLVFLLFLIGCTHLVPDNGTPISAIDAQFPTIEFQACSKTWRGLGSCVLPLNSDLKEYPVKIQGAYEGTLRVFTSGCPVPINESYVYTKHQVITLPIEGTIGTDCLINMVMSPKYEGHEDSGLVIEPIYGSLYLRTSEFNSRVKIDVTVQDVAFQIEEEYQSDVTLISSQCGISFNELLPALDGLVTIKLSEITKLTKKQCIVNGASLGQEDLLLVWYFSIYDSKFNPLPIPAVTMGKNKLTIKADASVSVISYGDKYKNGSELSFRYAQGAPDVIRLYTVKGRILMGTWDGAKWQWK